MSGVLPNLQITGLDVPIVPVFIGETMRIVVKVQNPALVPRRAAIVLTDKRPDGTNIKTSLGPLMVRGTLTFAANFKVETEGYHTIVAEAICTPFVRAPTTEATQSKQIQVLRAISAGGQGGQAGFQGGGPPVQQVGGIAPLFQPVGFLPIAQSIDFTPIVGGMPMVSIPSAPMTPPAGMAPPELPAGDVPPFFTVVPTLFGIPTPSAQGGGTQ